MLVILEAVSGPVAGRRIEVRAGTIVRIGRAGKSDHAIAEDSYLSGLHFSVQCDGAQCRIRDLGSSNGTFVNGARISEQVVQAGDSVVAGGSTFRIHIDLAPDIAGVGIPLVKTVTAPVSITSRTMGGAPGYTKAELTLINVLYGPGEQAFSIIDVSRDSRLPAFLNASGEAHEPLDAAGSAYLVALPAEAQLLHVLMKDGWGRGWGFYATSQTGLSEVRAHFINFVRLRTSSGAGLTFRFWDPRVLRALVPAMPQDEVDAFFGPCTRMIVEAEKSTMALEFSRNQPRQQTIVLA
jgi:hypothetical protein